MEDQQHISNHLTVHQKSELQKQEQKPSKNGNALAKARYGSPLIQDVHYSDLSLVLKYVMMKVGLRANNLPSEVEKGVLLDHIKKHYSGHTLDEIRLAFELAINEELDINPEETKCYENFSCAYFSRIMNAYKVWAANEYKMLRQEPPPQKIYSDEENDNLYRALTEEFYQRIKNGHIEPVPNYTRDILVKDKLILKPYMAEQFFTVKLGKQAPHIYEKNE